MAQYKHYRPSPPFGARGTDNKAPTKGSNHLMSLPMLELGPQAGHFSPLAPPIPLIRTKAIESTNGENDIWLLMEIVNLKSD